MRQVQTDFIDLITFRYDDETRRNLIGAFSRKETLLDADLLEEHLVNQPLLGCILLLLMFFVLASLIVAIVFVACRALGNCGAKRYQPHPTRGRRYFFYVLLFTFSWIAMAISASFFIQSGATMWNPKVPIDFIDLDHTIIKRNASEYLEERLSRSKREATTKRPISVFDLFADEDYRGDFEQTEATTTTQAAFVTATYPEENPIPISRTNKSVIHTTNTKIDRTDNEETEKLSSVESEDTPPAIDRLPIKRIAEQTTSSSSTTTTTTTTTMTPTTVPSLEKDHQPVSSLFEIPERPKAELDYGRQFEGAAPFVSNLWNGPRLAQTAADLPHIRQSKLQIQPIVPENERVGWTTKLPESNDVEEEEEDVKGEGVSAEGKASSETEILVPREPTPVSITPSPPNPAPLPAVIEANEDPLPPAATEDRLTRSETPSGPPTISLLASASEEALLSTEHRDADRGAEEKEKEEQDIVTAPVKVELTNFNAELEETLEVITSSEASNETSMEKEEETTKEMTTSTLFLVSSYQTSMATTPERENTSAMPLVVAFTDDGSLETEEKTNSSTEQDDLVLSVDSFSKSPLSQSTSDPTTESVIITTMETTVTTTLAPVTTAAEEVETTTEEEVEHIEMITIPAMDKTVTTTEGRVPLPIATLESGDAQNVEFVPIEKTKNEEEWKLVTELPKSAATLAVFPSVPLSPGGSQGKIEQLATPLLYPYRLLHTTAVVWMVRLSLIAVGLVMVVVTLPSLILVLLGSFFYKSIQHPIDRRKTSDQVGQIVVILATFLLFAISPLLCFVQIALTYHHFHNAICPSLQLKYQQDLGIIGPLSSLTPESRDVVLRNVVNRDNCQVSEAAIQTMWISCLCFALFSIPLIVSLFKLSKYYLRMKTEYYWNLSDYGTIGVKRQQSGSGQQDLYGNIYGTISPRRPKSRPPPVPSPQTEPSYADGPVYTDGPIYGVYQAYGRL